MKNNDAFLDTYRRLENIIREKYSVTVKEFEDTCSSWDSATIDKLKYCRVTRNFITHQDSEFCQATPQMISFITSLVEELDENEIPVKKKMITIKRSLLETATAVDAVSFCQKKKITSAPFFNSKGEFTGIWSDDALKKLILDGKSLKTTRLSFIKTMSMPKIAYVSEVSTISSIRDKLKEYPFVLAVNDNGVVTGWMVGD